MRTESVADCEICGSPGRALFDGLEDQMGSAPGSYSIFRCTDPSCAALWLSPRPLPEDIDLAYQTYYTHGDPGGRSASGPKPPSRKIIYRNWLWLTGLGKQREATLWLYLHDTPPGEVLDIGCGNGKRLAMLRDAGWTVQGQEVDEVSASVAVNTLGVPVFVGALEDAAFEDARFDAVIANHVLEHVYEPWSLLAEAFRVLKPGGTLVFVTPNARSLGQRTMGRDWRGLEVPRHIHIFAPAALRSVAKRAGLGEVRVWTTAANAETIAKESQLFRRKRRSGNRGAIRPTVPERIAAMAFATVALFYFWLRPDSGEECVLWAQKPAK